MAAIDFQEETKGASTNAPKIDFEPIDFQEEAQKPGIFDRLLANFTPGEIDIAASAGGPPSHMPGSEEAQTTPLLKLSSDVKSRIGQAALDAVHPFLGALISPEIRQGIGESIGGMIESLTSPKGVEALPALAVPEVGAIAGPVFGVPAMVEGGKEALTGATTQERAKGATTALLGAAAVAPLAKELIKGKGIEPTPGELPTESTKPPPLPEDVAKPGEEPAGVKPSTETTPPPLPADIASAPDFVPSEAQPPPSPSPEGKTPELPPPPTTETSIWKRLLEKHFDFTKPQEVFASTTPVSETTLDTLATAIKESKPARRETEELRRSERSRRAAQQSTVQAGTPGRSGVGQLKSVLAGELPRIDLEPFADKLSPADQDALYNHIYGHELLKDDVYRRSNLAIALQNLMENGHLPQPNQVAWFERIFGPQVAQAMLGKQRVASRSLRLLAELANIPRAAITSFDLSATLRQGFSLGVAHPEIASHAFEAQLKAFGDRDYALALDRNFRTGDQARVRDKSGLQLPSVEGMADPSREEVFTSRIIQQLQDIKPKSTAARIIFSPVYAYAKGLAGSERAYVTYLNWLRTRVFDSMDGVLRDSGLPEDILDLKRHQLAMMVNAATGRGNVPSNALLNAFFFSPKFMASRFEYPFRLAKVTGTDRTKVGMEARRQLAAHAAAWTGLYTLMHLGSQAFNWPVEFGYDPRSADFLKIHLGENTTIDTGAGYGQAIRLMARFLTGQTVDMVTEKEKRTDRASELGRFIRYKLAPVPGEVWSIAEGKTPDGKEISVPGVVADLTVPIGIQNATSLWQEFGAKGLPLLVPDLLGAGVNVYQQEPKRR